MTPRDQAIEELLKRHYGTLSSIRAIIDDYERARARLDGAKMVPREATEEMCVAGGKAQTLSIGSWGEPFVVYRAMHDATPKDGERG